MMLSHSFLHHHCTSERCNRRSNLLGQIVARRGRKLHSKLHESTNTSFCCSFEKEYTIQSVMLHTATLQLTAKVPLARLTMAGSVPALKTGFPLKSN